MIRLVHISDIHVSADRLDWRLQDWLNKRLLSWVNLRLFGRGKKFGRADEVMAALGDDLAVGDQRRRDW